MSLTTSQRCLIINCHLKHSFNQFPPSSFDQQPPTALNRHHLLSINNSQLLSSFTHPKPASIT
jgi:hypothetical protein